MVFKFWKKDEPHNIILMDIDGALSPLARVNEDSTLIDIDWKTFKIPNRLLTLLIFLEGKAQVVWNSMWMDLSNKINDQLEIAHYEYITYENPDSFDDWVKSEAILEFVKEHHNDNILIIDDELPNDSILERCDNVTLLHVDTKIGITKKQTDEIVSWLAKHSV